MNLLITIIVLTTIWCLEMYRSGIRRIVPGQILSLLLVAIFLPPISTEATETSSDQAAAQSQESDAAQGPEAGESNDAGSSEQSGGKEKNQEETEEEPDC